MAKRNALNLVVITPERQVLEETVDSIVIPAHDGELGILPSRAPLMCELGTGVLRFQSSGRNGRVFVDRGFAQVQKDKVIVLTQQAIPVEQITPEQIAATEKELAKSSGATVGDRAERMRLERKLGILKRYRSAG